MDRGNSLLQENKDRIAEIDCCSGVKASML